MSQIQIPKDWKVKKLEDISEVKRGISWSKSQESKTPTENSTAILRIGNIRERHLDLADIRYIQDLKSEIIAKSKVSKDDIMLVGSNGNREYVGRSCKIDKKMEFIYASFLMGIRKIIKEIEPDFLLYYLNSPQGWNFIRNSTSSGVGINNLKISKLREMPIIYPDKRIQIKIIKKLDHILDQLEEKKKQILHLMSKFDSKKINKNYKDHLLKLAFDGTLTNEQSVEINGIKVPKGWSLLTLPQIVKNEKNAIRRGPFGGSLKKKIFKDKGYLVYEQYHAIHDDFSMARYFIDEKKFNEMKNFKVASGDMIISCSGVTMGRIAQIPENALEGIINQALLKISLNLQIINQAYFKFLFRSDMIQKTIFKISRGTGMPNFPSLKEIKSILFLIPPIKTQKKIVQILEKKFADWENHKQEIENIEKRHIAVKKHFSDLSSLILTDAFAGKLVK